MDVRLPFPRSRALKLLGEGRAVKISAGLPSVRTSVAHGSGYDIAGRAIADAVSLIEATGVAALLTRPKNAAAEQIVASPPTHP